MHHDYDLILVGGGLANGLIALRLRSLRPQLRVLLLEAGDRLGGNHTWSFHQHDLEPSQWAWVAPLVSHRWQGQQVRFPGHRRQLRAGYASILADTFDTCLRERLGTAACCGSRVLDIGPGQVRLADGRTLQAGAVIDGRGPSATPHMTLGRQAFLGQVVRTAVPHGLRFPIIMDADVAQGEGYRFVYTLPFADDLLLIEDTHYVDGAGPSAAQFRDNIADYARAQGWEIQQVLREEQGVLPITLAGDLDAFHGALDGQPSVGLRAGLFHPTTGYSLPEAVRLAEHVAQLPRLDAPSLSASLQRYTRQRWRQQGFFRMLNRMLFLAGPANRRWTVMQRFYSLPEPLIERFYAGRLGWADKLRLLSGKPPVPLLKAARAALASHASLQRNS
ncbi:lycopene cyclase [Stenotrophomonas sp. Betaine-02u-21]|uniref:lycopene beta-cyclase CrtY n=1 Tax=unclassified Stenotrophomonas TaxID=196198 RepID=UPI000C344936|nr:MULTISPECIES: lycopene beta-cyclase CrtY [unclassified Stenotrophomonas]PKH69700.1 lycopene cyclase [Stenotrophomonas sp. Betaine-02u-23]PKH74194.1 lycopene cyclase [Stenotrophomonas sp. Betaine-02u-21]PKH94607.1 lycopene cyclase [Stenotrophomonas sp. Bg11-02]